MKLKLSLVLCLTTSLFAEHISFDDALQQFSAHNIEISILEKEKAKASADLITAQNRPNPTLSASMDYLRPKHITNLDASMATIHFDHPIELGKKRDRRIQNAKDNIKNTQLQIQEIKREKISDLIDVYYQVVSDEEVVTNAKADYEDFQNLLNISQSKFEHGFMTALDLQRLKLTSIEYKNNLDSSKTALQNDKESLALMLTLQADDIQTEPVKNPNPLLKSSQELINYAQVHRADCLQAQQAIQSAKSFVELQKANAIADLTVGVEYEAYGTGFGALFGLSASMPLPIYDQNKGEVEKSRINLLQAFEQKNRVFLQAQVDVTQAYLLQQNQIRVFNDLQKGFELAKEIKEKEEKVFYLKGISLLDLLDVQKNYREYKSKLIQAKIDLLVATQKLKLQSALLALDQGEKINEI